MIIVFETKSTTDIYNSYHSRADISQLYNVGRSGGSCFSDRGPSIALAIHVIEAEKYEDGIQVRLTVAKFRQKTAFYKNGTSGVFGKLCDGADGTYIHAPLFCFTTSILNLLYQINVL